MPKDSSSDLLLWKKNHSQLSNWITTHTINWWRTAENECGTNLILSYPRLPAVTDFSFSIQPQLSLWQATDQIITFKSLQNKFRNAQCQHYPTKTVWNFTCVTTFAVIFSYCFCSCSAFNLWIRSSNSGLCQHNGDTLHHRWKLHLGMAHLLHTHKSHTSGTFKRLKAAKCVQWHLEFSYLYANCTKQHPSSFQKLTFYLFYLHDIC